MMLYICNYTCICTYTYHFGSQASFEIRVDSALTARKLRQCIDPETARVTAPLTVDWFGAESHTQLAVRDRLTRFGPFEICPGRLQDPAWAELWASLERRLRELEGGAEGVAMTFVRGAYDGAAASGATRSLHATCCPSRARPWLSTATFDLG